MKLLAGLLAGSGVVWMVGLAVMNPFLLDPPALPLMVVSVCYVVAASGVMLAVRDTSQLPGRLFALWLLAVGALAVVMSQGVFDWYLVGFALLYGTIAFALWITPPLLLFSFVRRFWPRRPPKVGVTAQAPRT